MACVTVGDALLTERLFTFLQQMTNILPSHMERLSSMDFRWVNGLQILQVQNFRLVTKLYGSFDISTLIWLAHLAALFFISSNLTYLISDQRNLDFISKRIRIYEP